MAPIKFEDDFREKLEKRHIAPSGKAWEKLSERLDAEEGSSRKLNFWWIGMAASIIGIAFFAFQYFSSDSKNMNRVPEVIVDVPKVEHIKENQEDFESNQVETSIANDSKKQINKGEHLLSKKRNETFVLKKESNQIAKSENQIESIISMGAKVFKILV